MKTATSAATAMESDTASITASDVTNTSTAASRVFGLPELLEQILISLGQQEHSAPSDSFKPSVTLFCLQRVNSTFNAVITKTKILRVLMSLENDESNMVDEDTWQQSDLRAVWWLLKGAPSFWDGNQMCVVTFKAQSKSWFADWRSKVFAYQCLGKGALPEASWRNIKIGHCPIAKRKPFMRLIVETKPRFDSQLYDISLYPQCTLGDVYDFCNRVMDHTLDDMRRLSHISVFHDQHWDISKRYSLGSGEPLATGGILAEYHGYKKVKEDDQPLGWQAEEWKAYNIVSSGEASKRVRICAYCHGEREDRDPELLPWVPESSDDEEGLSDEEQEVLTNR